MAPRSPAAAAAICRAALAAAAALWLAAATEAPPPVVETVGRRPKLRIYPGGKSSGGNDTWIVLTFGKIEEMDPAGRRVRGRAIVSLSAEKGIIWSQENRSVGGAQALVTRMELPLQFGPKFPDRCGGPSGAGVPPQGGAKPPNGDSTTAAKGVRPPRKLLESEELPYDPDDSDDGRYLAATASVAIEVFVFQTNATVDYGDDYAIEVARGQMKFNIEAVGWPFCSSDHRLEVNLDVKVPGDRPPREVRERPEGDLAGGANATTSSAAGPTPPPPKGNLAADINAPQGKVQRPPREDGAEGRKPRRRPKRKAMRQSAGKKDFDFDFPEAVLVDNGTSECEVNVVSTGKKTNIAFVFPYFSESLLYDPVAGFIDDATPEGAMTKTVVKGSLTMSVADPAAFCASGEVLLGLKKAVARASQQDVSTVDLTCTPAAARRLAVLRRLAGDVNVEYNITIPEGSATAPTADATISNLGALSVAEITTLVNEELTKAGVTETITVTSKGTPAATLVTYTTTTTAMPHVPHGTSAAALAGAPGVVAAFAAVVAAIFA